MRARARTCVFYRSAEEHKEGRILLYRLDLRTLCAAPLCSPLQSEAGGPRSIFASPSGTVYYTLLGGDGLVHAVCPCGSVRQLDAGRRLESPLVMGVGPAEGSLLLLEHQMKDDGANAELRWSVFEGSRRLHTLGSLNTGSVAAEPGVAEALREDAPFTGTFVIDAAGDLLIIDPKDYSRLAGRLGGWAVACGGCAPTNLP